MGYEMESGIERVFWKRFFEHKDKIAGKDFEYPHCQVCNKNIPVVEVIIEKSEPPCEAVYDLMLCRKCCQEEARIIYDILVRLKSRALPVEFAFLNEDFMRLNFRLKFMEYSAVFEKYILYGKKKRI